MVQLFTKFLLLSAVLMLGFIFGIVYSNHVTEGPDSIFKKTDMEKTIEEEEEKESPSPPFKLKEQDQSQDLKIHMEDGEHLVIYNPDKEEVLEDLLEGVDIQRDLMEKQLHVVDTGNLFSEMGLRTAGVFEGTFRKLFSLVGE
ncbi:hypothetical protein [Evansella tamaricis]|uniref:Uncharacterized protein n=1 Tax=Evansella tamaricis TaxID=2069301 RepID=A0ABS6JLT7_9BACI|nr:hypothetical protein [Evansella tamaricis]MBU9713390.1 hypothetical protein [Evansella tamaricis]